MRNNVRPLDVYSREQILREGMDYLTTYTYDGKLVHLRVTRRGIQGSEFTIRPSVRNVDDVHHGPLEEVWNYGISRLLFATPTSEFIDNQPIVVEREDDLVELKRFYNREKGIDGVNVSEILAPLFGWKVMRWQAYYAPQGGKVGQDMSIDVEFDGYTLMDNVWFPMMKSEALYGFSSNSEGPAHIVLNRITHVIVREAHFNQPVASGGLDLNPEVGDAVTDYSVDPNDPLKYVVTNDGMLPVE